MKHDHSKFQKKIGMRQFQRNIYRNLPRKKDQSILITKRGSASFCLTALTDSSESKGVQNENDS